MAATVNTGMSKKDMKKLLTRSKEEPVNCAVGQGENPAFGLLMMSKLKSPKMLQKLLEAEFRDAKNVRFGTAFVDVDDNPKLVKLSLNRGASGLSKRLIKTLKGTGFTKVVLVAEDGSEETHEEADDTPQVDADDAPAEGATAAAAPPPPPPAPPAQPEAATPEQRAAQTASLAKVLAGLVAQLPKAADGAGEDDLQRKLAREAGANIKAGNFKAAGELLAKLKSEIDSAPSGKSASAQAIEASRVQWSGVGATVRAEVGKLSAALAGAYGDRPFAGDITARFQAKVAPVLGRFDDRLSTVLETMSGTTDMLERSKLATQARGLMKDYLSFATTDPLIADLDTNPFVPLAIRATVTGAVAQVAKAIQ